MYSNHKDKKRNSMFCGHWGCIHVIGEGLTMTRLCSLFFNFMWKISCSFFARHNCLNTNSFGDLFQHFDVKFKAHYAELMSVYVQDIGTSTCI